jgi:hypothetical protein
MIILSVFHVYAQANLGGGLVTEFLTRHPLIRRAFFMLVVYFCFNAVMLEFRASREYQRMIRWPITDASVNTVTVYATSYSWGGRTNRYCPKLSYNYSVMGHSYVGHNSVFDFTCWPDGYNFVAKHQPGTSIQIAYDPADPNITIIPASVQDPGYPWGDIIGGTLFLIVLLLDLFGSRASEARSAA